MKAKTKHGERDFTKYHMFLDQLSNQPDRLHFMSSLLGLEPEHFWVGLGLGVGIG